MAIQLVDANLILHIFDGHDEFRSYYRALGLKSSNMDELLAGGSGTREDVESSFKYGHAQLWKLRWIRSDSGVYVPVLSYDMAVKTLGDLGYKVERVQLKNLCLRRAKKIKELDAQKNVVRVWTLASQPSAVSSLQCGASLLGLVDQPLPTYQGVGAQTVTGFAPTGATSSSQAAAASAGGGAHMPAALGPTTAPQVRVSSGLTRAQSRTAHRMPAEPAIECS